jgi:hypothetical protein
MDPPVDGGASGKQKQKLIWGRSSGTNDAGGETKRPRNGSK